MSWGEAVLADGTRASISLSPGGELNSAEPWTTLRLPSGQEIMVPTESFRYEGGVYRLEVSLQELGLELESTPETTIIPIISEELEVQRHQVPTAQVSVETRVEEHRAVVDELLVTESVDIERVAVGREVAGPQPVRYEGDMVIIPVVEEVLVLQKRFMLTEEVRVRRRSENIPTRQEVTLRRQTAEVVRQPVEGDQ